MGERIGIGIGIGSKEQQKNLKQRGKVEGDSNCTDASHHGVAEQGEGIGIVRLLEGLEMCIAYKPGDKDLGSSTGNQVASRSCSGR